MKSTTAILAGITVTALLLTAIAATPLAMVHTVKAQGLNNSPNFGQCKKEFTNGNGCNSTVKPGNSAFITEDGSGNIVFVDNNGANPPSNKGHNNCHCG
jgi:hypothetical protein